MLCQANKSLVRGFSETLKKKVVRKRANADVKNVTVTKNKHQSTSNHAGQELHVDLTF